MRLMSLMKKLISSDNESDKIDDCYIEVKLKVLEFRMLTELFVMGNIGYRDIAKFVYLNNTNTMTKNIFNPLNKKAENGCEFNKTMIRFYDKNKLNYLDISLELFARKDAQKVWTRFKSTQWFQHNIKLIKKYNKSYI